MSATLAPILKFREFDANGDPLAGGKLYSYLAGTTTPAATYTDQGGLSANPNPVILDADGRADVWIGTGSYKFILKDANDVTIWTVDGVNDTTGSATTSPWVEHAVTDGQAATALSGETIDFASYSSAMYDVEIIRGTAVIANGQIAVQNLNGTGRVSAGLFMTSEAHGVFFSVVNTTGQIWQLRASLTTGPGNGTIKLYKRSIPA